MNPLKLIAFLCLSTVSFAQAAHRISQVLVRGNNTAANVAPYAKINVCVINTACDTEADVFADASLTTPLDLPLTADANGNYNYYIASGCVDEQISAAGQGLINLKHVCPSNGQSGGGGGNIQPLPQFHIPIQPNSGSQSVLGPSSTSINAVAPIINYNRNINLFCNNPSSPDGSCFTNALASQSLITVPPGNYAISGTINISQNRVTIACIKGAVFVQQTDSSMFNVTGANVTFDGCGVDTNGHANQIIQVTGATNFAFNNGTITNAAASYAIRVDSTTNVSFINNVCATTSSCGQIFASSSVKILNNSGTGGFNVQSPSTGGAGNSITFSGNDLIPQVGGTILTTQDASGSSNPITSLSITGNHCRITGTSDGARPFGCFSIVQHVSKCAISNNTIDSVDQFLQFGPVELGVDSCSITGNVINSPDSHTSSYSAIQSYGGGNVFSGNVINGWGVNGGASAIRIYPQNSDGSAHAADGNIIIGNTITAATGEQIGLGVFCNNSGSSAFNTKIIGNTITGAGSLARAINLEDDVPPNCLVSTTIDNNLMVNADTGIQIANVTMSAGKNEFNNVTTKLSSAGASTNDAVNIIGPIITPAITPTGLTASAQGLCYPTANSPITNSGCAQINAGQVTFTPTAIGWYRIIAGNSETVRGTIDIAANFANGHADDTVDFSIAANSGQGDITARIVGLYGGNYGPVDMIRASVDGTTQVQYLDLHINNITGVQPITVVFYGQTILPQFIVANPVVGAVVGANSVKIIDFNSLPLGPAAAVATTGPIYVQGSAVCTAASPCTSTVSYTQFTTTSSTSESVTITGLTPSSGCTFSAREATAATNIATSFISAYGSGSLTFEHTAAAGMVYGFLCKL